MWNVIFMQNNLTMKWSFLYSEDKHLQQFKKNNVEYSFL